MKNWLKWTAGILAGVAFLFLLPPKTMYAANPADGVNITPCTAAMVARQMCTVRSAPSKEAQKLASLNQGTVVNVCGYADNGWYQVVYQTGLGYVHGNFLTEVYVEETMRQALAAQAELIKQGIVQGGGQESAVPDGAAAGEKPEEAALPVPAGNPASPLPAQTAAGNVIFVGDSRTGQMSNAVGGSAAWPGVAFVACYGGGVEWLSTPKAKKDIDELVAPGSVIVINYGVNDLNRHGEYIETINRYAHDWKQKGAAVYFASVGPVGENEHGKRNWAVEYFNEQLNNRLSGEIGRIDLYGYLMLAGYGMEPDGLHYTADTYALIFQFLMQSIGRMGETG